MPRFHRDEVELHLAKSEYIFVYLSLSYVLHWAHLEDHDLTNILCMTREGAETLLTQIGEGDLDGSRPGQVLRDELDVVAPEQFGFRRPRRSQRPPLGRGALPSRGSGRL